MTYPCVTCSSSGCKGDPCPRLESQLPPDTGTREFLLPSSSLMLLASRARVSWQDRIDGVPTGFKGFPFLSDEDNAMLKAKYIDKLSHNALSEKLGLTPGSVRVKLYRIRRRVLTSRHKKVPLIKVGVIR